MSTSLPKDLTPLNVHAYLSNHFGLCGCTDVPLVVAELRRLLEWCDDEIDTRADYDALFPHNGTFYILVGIMDSLGLVEHGTAIRHPWLAPDGERLLRALTDLDPQAVEDAHGVAYDGLHYGETP